MVRIFKANWKIIWPTVEMDSFAVNSSSIMVVSNLTSLTAKVGKNHKTTHLLGPIKMG